MKFWAGLGSWGSREKKAPNCHKYATFWSGLFNFLWEKNIFFENILASALKSYTASKIFEKFGKYFVWG